MEDKLFPVEGRFVIIDLRTMDFMKDEEGKIDVYATYDEASLVCGMYEFEDAWIMELKCHYVDDEHCPPEHRRNRS